MISYFIICLNCVSQLHPIKFPVKHFVQQIDRLFCQGNGCSAMIAFYMRLWYAKRYSPKKKNKGASCECLVII